MIDVETINKFQNEYGLKLLPLQDGSKKPKLKDGKWKGVNWSIEELQRAKRLGVYHQDGLFDVDADKVEASKYMHLLPATLTIGKKTNSGIITTHKLYVYGGNKKTESLGKGKDCGTVIELLQNTQTHIIGDRELINDVQPRKLTDTEFQDVRQTLRKIYALTILSEHYPSPTSKRRDEFVLRVAGTLARECKHWDTHIKEEFIEALCVANGDTQELQNRTNKVRYQEEQLKLGHEVAGVKSLCEFIGVKQLDCIDKLRKEKVKGITVLTLGELMQRSYPPVHYVIYPLMATETIMQVWSRPGLGKTWFGLELAASLANGHQFLRWKPSKDMDEQNKQWPILYVEGEMRASSLQDRLGTIFDSYMQRGEKFNFNYFNIAPLAEQPNQTFTMLNEEAGRENIEIRLEEIHQRTGKKPFLFLDNVSCLTSIQEKDGVEWLSFMGWLIRLRARGYSVVFFHHATKAGDSSSGSNMKERAVDIEIKLDVPDKDEKIESKTGAQFKLSFEKWREFNNSSYTTPFIATLDRHHHRWETHEIMKKTKRKVAAALNGSGGDVKAAMAATGLSQAQLYRYKKEIDKEHKLLNKKSNGGGSLSEQRKVRDANRSIAEQKIAEKYKEEIDADRKQ